MGRRLMLGFCGGLLVLGAAACGGGGGPAGASSGRPAAGAVKAGRAQECTKTVLAAVADKLWVDSGQVTDDSESVERNQRGRDFAAAYVAKPEMEIFMRADSDGVIAVNGGATVTEAVAGTTDRITSECADAYPE